MVKEMDDKQWPVHEIYSKCSLYDAKGRACSAESKLVLSQGPSGRQRYLERSYLC